TWASSKTKLRELGLTGRTFLKALKGYRFSDTVSSSKSDAPLGAIRRLSVPNPPSTAQQKYVSVGQEVPLNHKASDCSRRDQPASAVSNSSDRVSQPGHNCHLKKRNYRQLNPHSNKNRNGKMKVGRSWLKCSRRCEQRRDTSPESVGIDPTDDA